MYKLLIASFLFTQWSMASAQQIVKAEWNSDRLPVSNAKSCVVSRDGQISSVSFDGYSLFTHLQGDTRADVINFWTNVSGDAIQTKTFHASLFIKKTGERSFKKIAGYNMDTKVFVGSKSAEKLLKIMAKECNKF